MRHAAGFPDNFRGHHTVNVSYLMPCHSSGSGTHTSPPPYTFDREGEPVFDVERIVAVRWRGRGTQYLAKWAGYLDDENTWEPKRNVVHTDAYAKILSSIDENASDG